MLALFAYRRRELQSSASHANQSMPAPGHSFNANANAGWIVRTNDRH
jgi:hypothetical protein